MVALTGALPVDLKQLGVHADTAGTRAIGGYVAVRWASFSRFFGRFFWSILLVDSFGRFFSSILLVGSLVGSLVASLAGSSAGFGLDNAVFVSATGHYIWGVAPRQATTASVCWRASRILTTALATPTEGSVQPGPGPGRRQGPDCFGVALRTLERRACQAVSPRSAAVSAAPTPSLAIR